MVLRILSSLSVLLVSYAAAAVAGERAWGLTPAPETKHASLQKGHFDPIGCPSGGSGCCESSEAHDGVCGG